MALREDTEIMLQTEESLPIARLTLDKKDTEQASESHMVFSTADTSVQGTGRGGFKEPALQILDS